MISGEIKSQVDQTWNAFWTGGISNPLEVIEQMTYLLFIKRLDELHTAQEKKANRLQRVIENPIFPAEVNPYSKVGRTYDMLRWSKFKNTDASTMYEIISEEVFPFIKNLAHPHFWWSIGGRRYSEQLPKSLSFTSCLSL